MQVVQDEMQGRVGNGLAHQQDQVGQCRSQGQAVGWLASMEGGLRRLRQDGAQDGSARRGQARSNACNKRGGIFQRLPHRGERHHVIQFVTDALQNGDFRMGSEIFLQQAGFADAGFSADEQQAGSARFGLLISRLKRR